MGGIPGALRRVGVEGQGGKGTADKRQGEERKRASRGRLRDTRVVALDALAGIKIYPVDYLEQFTRELYRKSPKD